ncbi:MAG: NEW3 domain-containing protein [Nocardioides sp.]|uniref:NEW3 domain-containing protein n=1 Tax=Nocardioides sp. TaxID=35761 RepID=UPI0039E3384D
MSAARTPHPLRGRTTLAALTILGLVIAFVAATLGPTQAAPMSSRSSYDPSAKWDRSSKPYLGWSSWSMQATRRDGVNPNGSYSWLTEDAIKAQADYMAAHLKKYGYRYINIDAGWWRTWNWTPVYDDHGRPAVWSERLPSGMKEIVKYIHSKGLKVGIYLPAGMETGKEGDNGDVGQDLTKTIAGAPECTLADAIYDDQRLTNGWQSSYALDFEKDNGCAAAYVDSLVDLFEGWGGVDLLKLDGFGPGSGHTDVSGDNARYDNRPELAEYDKAFQATGHHVEIQVSWAIPQAEIESIVPYADSWRTEADVECYCDDLTRWSTASSRLDAVASWAGLDGPDRGWNNLDSLEVGSADLDGLTETERQSVMALWSIAAAPLYLGDDLTQIDDYGLKLITNRNVLAVNQDRLGAPLRVLQNDGSTYVFARTMANGDVAVGLFNKSDQAATVSTSVDDLGLAKKSRVYGVTDLFAHTNRQTTGAINAALPAHGSALLRVSASSAASWYPAAVTLSASADSSSVSTGGKVSVPVALTNNGGSAIVVKRLQLTAPSGWKVKATKKLPSTLGAGKTMTVTFTATAPATADDPISTAALTAIANYRSAGKTVKASTPLDLSVVSPLSDDYQTANTTGVDALFAQSGEVLAVQAAGTNVGPTTSGPTGSTAGADEYGAIYQAGAVSDGSTVEATVSSVASGKAGIMVRNDMDGDGSPVGVAFYVTLSRSGSYRVGLVSSSSGATEYDTTLGGTSAATVTLPVTLRLVRSGTVYEASYSVDAGSTWTTLGTATLDASAAADSQDAGVFASSGSSTAGLALFADFDVEG